MKYFQFLFGHSVFLTIDIFLSFPPCYNLSNEVRNKKNQGLLLCWYEFLCLWFLCWWFSSLSFDFLNDVSPQPFFSTVLLNHASQPCFSTILLNRAPQPCTSTMLLNHAPQPCSSNMHSTILFVEYLCSCWVRKPRDTSNIAKGRYRPISIRCWRSTAWLVWTCIQTVHRMNSTWANRVYTKVSILRAGRTFWARIIAV
jgi:hypothetical protein